MRVNTVTSHREKLVSGLGGFVSILAAFGLTAFVEAELAISALLLASMGATAVLLFAAPHGPLSQPWNVLGGHVLSATVAVAVHALLPHSVFGGALAVGLSIAAMHYAGCLHPPGAATALMPFVGGPAVAAYGWWFPLFPAGFGAALMVLFAMAYNWPFSWRRYPARFAPAPKRTAYPDISHADLVAALSQIDSFIDVGEDDLLRIYELSTGRSRADRPDVRFGAPKTPDLPKAP
ncbi:MAG: HPP family protein [Phyllobacteriaceae bacterium]|nr:HPP family protein [Phyllobacteriaceae bacterium]